MRCFTAILVALLACLGPASARSLFDARPHIAGGGIAVPQSHPYIVALLNEALRPFCGGTLVSDKWVISAAHCYEPRSPGGYVAAGAHNLADKEPKRIIVPVDFYYRHENYGGFSLRNDIAVISLAKSLGPYISDGKFLKPIRLPRMSDARKSYVGAQVTMAGWGRTANRTSPPSPILKSFRTTVLTDKECEETGYIFAMYDKEHHLCTSAMGSQGACFGDSGGPLTEVEPDGEETLIGIASYISHPDNCENGGPTTFTRVAKNLEWIKRVTKNEVQIRS